MDFYKVTFTNEYTQFAKTPKDGIKTRYEMTEEGEPYTETMLQTDNPVLPLNTTRKLVKATKLKGKVLKEFLWAYPRQAYHIEAGQHIKLMCTELRKIGFTIDDSTTETLTATHNKYHIQIVFSRWNHREVYWTYAPKHPDFTAPKRFPLGRWMGANSTTESSLDFNTLKEIYTRITDLLSKFDSAKDEEQKAADKAFKAAKKKALKGIPHQADCKHIKSAVPINECQCNCYEIWWFRQAFIKE